MSCLAHATFITSVEFRPEGAACLSHHDGASSFHRMRGFGHGALTLGMGFEQRDGMSRAGHGATERVHHQFTDGIDLIRIRHPQQFLSFMLIGFL